MNTEERFPLTTIGWNNAVVNDDAETAIIRDRIIFEAEEDRLATIRSGDWDDKYPNPCTAWRDTPVRVKSWMFVTFQDRHGYDPY